MSSDGGVTVIVLVGVGVAALAAITGLAVLRNELAFRANRGDESVDLESRSRCSLLGRCANCCKGMLGGAALVCGSLISYGKRKRIKIRPSDDHDDEDDDEDDEEEDEEARRAAEEEAALAKRRARLPSVDLMQLNRSLLRDKLISKEQSAQISRLVVQQHILLIMLVKRSQSRSPKVALAKDPKFVKGLMKLARSELQARSESKEEGNDAADMERGSGGRRGGGGGGGARGGLHVVVGKASSAAAAAAAAMTSRRNEENNRSDRAGAFESGSNKRPASQWQHAMKTTLTVGRMRRSGGSSGNGNGDGVTPSPTEREDADVEV